MDHIFIKEIKIKAYHGVFPCEKKQGQIFHVSCEIFLDLSLAGMTDDLHTSINYADISDSINKYFTLKTFDLIEKAGEFLALNLLNDYDTINKITVEIHKPHAPLEIEFKDVGIKITRERAISYIALGSNLSSDKFGNSHDIIKQAIGKIDQMEFTSVNKESSLITTPPYGVTDQGDFINGVIEIETLLSPYYLLNRLLEIELYFERVRKKRWGPRTLDLDLILYGDHILYSNNLILPHPGMHVRDFVLRPLVEISPQAFHPKFHETAFTLLDKLQSQTK